MRLELTGRHVEISPALRRLVDTKLAKLERLVNDAAVSAQIVLTREKRGMHADITLHARGENFLHGVGRGEEWGPSIALAVDKIVRQAGKVKGKWQERKRHGSRSAIEQRASEGPRAAAPRAPGSRRPRDLKSVRQTAEPMSIAAAIRQLGKQAAQLVVFRESVGGSVSVLYRGHDGALTLVETES